MSNPNKIFFGKDTISSLEEVIKDYGKDVLFIYGEQSIKETGTYETILKILLNNKRNVIEFPNNQYKPYVQNIQKILTACNQNIDVILALGGGSVIDCAKGVAAGYHYDGDFWDLTENRQLIKKAIPIIAVPTIAGSGSEINQNASITNEKTQEKLGIGHPLLIPEVAIIDPSYTFSVSKKYTVAGVIDTLSHVVESYFDQTQETFLQDRLGEAMFKTVLHYCPIVLNEPENYEARANLMWASSLALSGLISKGKTGRWTCHPIEHVITAKYGINHGEGLGVIIPRWMNYVLSSATELSFVNYAVNMWGIERETEFQSDIELGRLGIESTYTFIKELGAPSTFTDLGIEYNLEELKEIAAQVIKNSDIRSRGFVSLDEKDILAILKSCFQEMIF